MRDAAGFDAADAARVGRLATCRDLADYERAFDASAEVVDEALRDATHIVDKALAVLRARGVIDAPPAP